MMGGTQINLLGMSVQLIYFHALINGKGIIRDLCHC
jgi:hypothetical protein